MFETRTGTVVRGALDGLAVRHRVFANNIANLETPGFQPRDVRFEGELRKLRDSLAQDPGGGRASIQSEDAAPSISLAPVADPQETSRRDGNGVQADRQMIRLEENTLTYEALTQAARLRAELLRSVLNEGRR